MSVSKQASGASELEAELESLLEGSDPSYMIEHLLDSEDKSEWTRGVAFIRMMLASDANDHWQTQALGFHLIRSKRRWKKLHKKFEERIYVSYGELCYDYGVSPSTGYSRADNAAHPRFEALRRTDCTMYLAEEFYRPEVGDELFALLVNIVALGCPDKRVAALLKTADPLEAARRLANKILGPKREALVSLELKLGQPEKTKEE